MIYRSDLAVSEVMLHSVHDFFEALVVKLITGCGRTNIAVLYRPPSLSVQGTPVGTFCNQFTRLFGSQARFD